jgi:Rieske Fe-S protein
VNEPWSFAEVEFIKQIKTARGPRESSFPGYVIRLPDDLARSLGLRHGLYAVSRICPHEGCTVNFYRQRSEVSYPLPLEEFPNPMLVCTCHQSIFDPAQKGRVVAGPAERAPWVFEFVVERGWVVIKELEAGGEKWG